jgi:polyisoprenoid-binding protein YceI
MRPVAFFVIALAALSPAQALAEAETYAISPAQSELLVFVHKDGIAARLAHNHIIYASIFDGTLTFDPVNHKKTRIKVTLQTQSLVADSPVLIKKYGVDNDASLSDRGEIEKTMKGRLQLDVDRFPTISFSGRLSKPIVNGQSEIVGKITIHGKTRVVRAAATIDDAPSFVRGTARVPLKLTDFGITPYSAFLGAIKIKNDVELMVDVFANKMPIDPQGKRRLPKIIKLKRPPLVEPPAMPKAPRPQPDPTPW